MWAWSTNAVIRDIYSNSQQYCMGHNYIFHTGLYSLFRWSSPRRSLFWISAEERDDDDDDDDDESHDSLWNEHVIS